MKLRLIACEIFYREICLLVAGSPHRCDLDFLPKGLHDLGSDKMQARLQEQVNAIEPGAYDAILLVYGLCNNGVVGLRSAHTRVVIPRAHDCIAVFMGSRQKYWEYFNQNPGTYYRTTGWIERDDSSGTGEATITQKLGLFMQFEELVQRYGEDNARYIMETMGDGTANYSRLTYISLGLDGEAPFVEKARAEARRNGWSFEQYEGSLQILRKLVNGDWDSDVLVLEPGESIAPSHDPDVIRRA